MNKYIQPYQDGDKKKYLPARVFLIIVLLILAGMGWQLFKMPFRGAPLPIQIAKIFFILLWSILVGSTIFAFILLTKDSIGGEVVYAGIVTSKEEIFDMNIPGRGNMHTRFNFQLDNGKRFSNVAFKFYLQIEEGKQVEVHTTRFSREILYVVNIGD